MNHLNQAPDMTYLASFVAMITGTMTWLNDNAGAVGALCAIGGLLVAIATYCRNSNRPK